MSNFRIEQALAEMRSLSGRAAEPEANGRQPGIDEFSDLLKQAVTHVNERQVEAEGLSNAYMRGDEVQLTDVMIASQKAQISFEAMKEVRNRLLEAYQEISNMQV